MRNGEAGTLCNGWASSMCRSSVARPVVPGRARLVGNPVKLSAFPDPPTRRPAPELDADGERIRREFSPKSISQVGEEEEQK